MVSDYFAEFEKEEQFEANICLKCTLSKCRLDKGHTCPYYQNERAKFKRFKKEYKLNENIQN